jgi:hypothetical protein
MNIKPILSSLLLTCLTMSIIGCKHYVLQFQTKHHLYDSRDNWINDCYNKSLIVSDFHNRYFGMYYEELYDNCNLQYFKKYNYDGVLIQNKFYDDFLPQYEIYKDKCIGSTISTLYLYNARIHLNDEIFDNGVITKVYHTHDLVVKKYTYINGFLFGESNSRDRIVYSHNPVRNYNENDNAQEYYLKEVSYKNEKYDGINIKYITVMYYGESCDVSDINLIVKYGYANGFLMYKYVQKQNTYYIYHKSSYYKKIMVNDKDKKYRYQHWGNFDMIACEEAIIY